jgi:hypothetical protein
MIVTAAEVDAMCDILADSLDSVRDQLAATRLAVARTG